MKKIKIFIFCVLIVLACIVLFGCNKEDNIIEETEQEVIILTPEEELLNKIVSEENADSQFYYDYSYDSVNNTMVYSITMPIPEKEFYGELEEKAIQLGKSCGSLIKSSFISEEIDVPEIFIHIYSAENELITSFKYEKLF